MPDMIKDGKGSGFLAQVNDENKLRTYSTTESEISYESETNFRSYSWTNVTYNYTAGDTILLVKNTSITANLIIDKIVVSGDVETEVVIHSPTCTTPTGTAVTGVNLNRTSSLTASATAKANESTNSQANPIWKGRIDGNSTLNIELHGSIILGLNNCIAIDFTTVGSACNVTILGYYHSTK